MSLAENTGSIANGSFVATSMNLIEKADDGSTLKSKLQSLIVNFEVLLQKYF